MRDNAACVSVVKVGNGIRGWTIFLVFSCALHAPRSAAALWNDHPDAGDETATLHWCEKKSRVIASVKREADALVCADFYFAHQDQEYGNDIFGKTLKFLKRGVELNPKNFETHTLVIWLHYSRWTAYRESPTGRAEFRDDLTIAYGWADFFERHFAGDGAALKALADQLNPIWFYYDRSLFARLIDLYRRAEFYSSESPIKVRCRLDIAHAYRKLGDVTNAVAGYRTVLELDPTNAVALRYLEKLSAPMTP